VGLNGKSRPDVKVARGFTPTNGTPAATRAVLNGHATTGFRQQPALTTNGSPKSIPADQTARVLQDRQLVVQCISGNVTAWSTLYEKCHHWLLDSIRTFLGRAGNDSNLVDEIAARTWYRLVKNDFELLARFDVKYGCRLGTFLAFLAKNEARLLFRSERRRRAREQTASRPEIQKSVPNGMAAISDEEFIATLSPAERAFFFEVLFAPNNHKNESRYSDGNRWQLRYRIRRKLQQFLD